MLTTEGTETLSGNGRFSSASHVSVPSVVQFFLSSLRHSILQVWHDDVQIWSRSNPLWIGLLCAVLCGLGCTPRIIPPVTPKNAVPIFIADYGRHSSLLLPDEKGGLVEFAWGDYAWFAENHTGAGNAVAALFWSGGSTLGSRHLPKLLPHDELMHSLSAKRLLSFVAEADKAAIVREQLTDQFNRHRDTMIYNEVHHLNFVRDDGHYWFAHNCNHLTAEWLRELGCQVEGWVLYSNFEMDDPRQ